MLSCYMVGALLCCITSEIIEMSISDSLKLLYTLKLKGKIKESGLTNLDTMHMANFMRNVQSQLS
jgi:diketogulonate reductase-like aldo/keto reductase